MDEVASYPFGLVHCLTMDQTSFFWLQLDWTDIIGDPREHRYCLPML